MKSFTKHYKICHLKVPQLVPQLVPDAAAAAALPNQFQPCSP